MLQNERMNAKSKNYIFQILARKAGLENINFHEKDDMDVNTKCGEHRKSKTNYYDNRLDDNGLAWCCLILVWLLCENRRPVIFL